jgi:outer membrane lipoprotein SlyB
MRYIIAAFAAPQVARAAVKKLIEVWMKKISLALAALAAAAILLAGCEAPAPQPYYVQQPYPPQGYPPPPAYGPPPGYQQRQGYPPPPPPQRAATSVGVVDRIEVIRKGDTNNVAGTVIGGIVGGLIGHQVGHGSGQTAATIIGAAGGAYAGNQVQQRQRGANETFRVTVRLDNGAYQTLTQDDISDLRTGERVRIEANRIYRM